MWPRWLVPRYGIRTLLLAVAAVAVGLWWFYTLPVYLPDRQDRLARASIDPYELSIAGDGDSAKAPPELVAILGDSRLRHWWRPYSLAFLDQSRLFSHGQDDAAYVWDVESGQQVRRFITPAATANRQASKVFLASPTAPDVIEVWNTTTWKQEKVLKCETRQPVVFFKTNATGTRLVVCFGEYWKERVVQVWDVAAGNRIREFKHNADSFPFLAVDEEGRRLAFGDDRQIKVVDVESGEVLGSFDPFANESQRAAIYVAAFDKEENHLMTGDAAGRVVTWDYTSGTEVASMPEGRTGSATALAFNDDKSHLIVANSQSARYFSRGRQGWQFWQDMAPDDVDHVTGAAVSTKSGNIALACGDHSIRLSSFRGQILLPGGKEGDVACLAFDHARKYVATTGHDGRLTLWNYGTWRPVRSWRAETGPVWQLAFAPGGELLVAGQRGIVVWNPESGSEERIIKPTGFFHGRFAITSDGKLVAAPHMLPDAPYSIGFWNFSDGSLFKTISSNDPTSSQRGELAFDPADKSLIIGGGKGITVWDVASSKLLANLGSKTIHDVPVAVHPDGKRVAMQPWYGAIEVWDITAQKNVLTARVHRGKGLVNSIAIHPDGKWAASAADDGSAAVWDIDTGAIVKSWQLGPPKGIVRQVAFSPDGRYLATVNGNGTAYLLRLDGLK